MIARQPKILVIHTLKWLNAARLAIAFRDAGCAVSLVCRRGHPAASLSGLDAVHRYDPSDPVGTLRRSILSTMPDLVIPCDDPAVFYLHRLYAEAWSTPAASEIAAIIERSLGNPDFYARLDARSELGALAEQAQVRMPATQTIDNADQYRDWLERHGPPLALKLDGTWGGKGVAIVETAAAARRGFWITANRIRIERALKRLVIDREIEPALDLLRGRRSKLSVQAFIRGRLATCAIACWQGEVIGAIVTEVLQTQRTQGHATVLQTLDHPEMLAAAGRLVRLLGATGFCGFDFILDAVDARPYLIEINPRATQINHLALGPGRSPVAALCARLSGAPLRTPPAMTGRDTIALFPHEYLRDPKSPYLETAYHDLPLAEPALIRAYLGEAGAMPAAAHGAAQGATPQTEPA